jgi:hypothetical protein
MPNGKCGDHPVTDILIHKRRTYSAEADSLIAEIVRLGGRNEFERSINPFAPPPLPELEKALREMHERILKEAKGRGWEV